MQIRITVPGDPVVKARPRVTRYGTYTPKHTLNYERKVRECWMEQSGQKIPDGPVEIEVKCYFQVPKSSSKKEKMSLPGTPYLKHKDLDNCIKSITDGLQGYAFGDDCNIYRIVAEKRYSDGEGYAEITIEQQ